MNVFFDIASLLLATIKRILIVAAIGLPILIVAAYVWEAYFEGAICPASDKILTRPAALEFGLRQIKKNTYFWSRLGARDEASAAEMIRTQCCTVSRGDDVSGDSSRWVVGMHGRAPPKYEFYYFVVFTECGKRIRVDKTVLPIKTGAVGN